MDYYAQRSILAMVENFEAKLNEYAHLLVEVGLKGAGERLDTLAPRWPACAWPPATTAVPVMW